MANYLTPFKINYRGLGEPQVFAVYGVTHYCVLLLVPINVSSVVLSCCLPIMIIMIISLLLINIVLLLLLSLS